MKRGRPSIRNKIQPLIIEVLSKSEFPLNISSIQKKISQETKTSVNWNSVKKYLDELVKLEKVKAIPLPHSKKTGETGLIVYSLKK